MRSFDLVFCGLKTSLIKQFKVSHDFEPSLFAVCDKSVTLRTPCWTARIYEENVSIIKSL